MASPLQIAGRVVAGLNATPESDAAVGWAAEWALRTRRGLTLLGVNDPLVSTFHEQEVASRLRAEAFADLAVAASSARARLAAEYPDVDVTVELVDGSAIAYLTWATEHAALVVLGTRRLRKLENFLTAGVGDVVITRARGPVVTVPPDGGSRGGPVVLAEDASGATADARRFALEAARVRGGRLIAVHVLEGERDSDGNSARCEERVARVDEALGGFANAYPGVSVERRFAHGSTLQALIDVSEDASLLVLGGRGRRWLTGMLLGSTSRDLVPTSRCPVAVVRGRRGHDHRAPAIRPYVPASP